MYCTPMLQLCSPLHCSRLLAGACPQHPACPSLALFPAPPCPPRLQHFSDVFPHLLTARDVPPLVKIEDVSWDNVDAGGLGSLLSALP